MIDPVPSTVDEGVRRALDAYARLQELAEEVEDEWMYIQDLTAAHRERLEAIASEEGARPLDEAAGAAIVTASDESGRISDPHRAIDWLSTFPGVVALALGREP